MKKVLTKSYQEFADYSGAMSNRMEMGREVIADKGIWQLKEKRYILNVHNSEGVQYKETKNYGHRKIKSSTPELVRNKMKELFPILVGKTQEEAQEFVANFRKEFNKIRPEDIAFASWCSSCEKI